MNPPTAPPPWAGAASVLAVVAHPDDESFGLGAVLAGIHRGGATVGVVCFTHGEASTLGARGHAGGGLRAVRAEELEGAARLLGVEHVRLHDYPDGKLAGVPPAELARLVEAAGREQGADLLVVFDRGGVTGHPDHAAATEAALAAADHLDVPVVAWAVTVQVADHLNVEFATAFAGRPDGEIGWWVPVDRRQQLAAIACHRSQSAANPVLWRRLELTGPSEPLLLLRPGPPGGDAQARTGT